MLSSLNRQMERDLTGGKQNRGLFCRCRAHIVGLLHAPFKIPRGGLAEQKQEAGDYLAVPYAHMQHTPTEIYGNVPSQWRIVVSLGERREVLAFIWFSFSTDLHPEMTHMCS